MLRVLLQPIQRTFQTFITGGRQGQVLMKKSDEDNDVEWANLPDGTVVVDNSLDTTSSNAVSNAAVSECLIWHEVD